MITRRDFAKRTGLGLLVAAVGGSMFSMEGCNFAGDILNWAPIGLAAFNSLVTMLETFGIINPAAPALGILVAAVRTAFADLIADVQFYQSIQPPPVGAVAKIQAVLTILAQNIKNLFGQINTTAAPIVNLIIGLSQLLLGVIAGFLNKINSQLGIKTATLSNTFSVGGQTVSYLPLQISQKAFKSQFNNICASQGHYEMYLK